MKYNQTKKVNDKLLVVLPSVALATVAGLGAVQKLSILDMVHAEQEQAGVTIEAQSVLSLALTSESVTLPIVPTTGGQFGRTSLGVIVTSNTGTGYNLAMQADKSDLMNGSADDAKIPSKKDSFGNGIQCSDESENACKEFPANEWGYRVNEQNKYLSIADVVDTLQEIDRVRSSEEDFTNGRKTTVYFGAKLNSQIPTGEYSGVNLTFVVTANPVPDDINCMTYMQDFAMITSKEEMDVVLGTMMQEQQYTLTDIRDGKTYFIAKLKDGNVWMTQNLDLDINGENASLNSDTSDLNTSGTAPYAQDYAMLDGTIVWTPTNKTIDIIGDTVTGWTNDENAPYSADIGDIAYGSDGNHSKVGNYYNWTAAIASSDSTDINTKFAKAENSICPKGWRLPEVISSSVGDFATLNTQYNGGKTDNNAGLIASPLYFVRGGYVHKDSYYGPDSYGGYWSSAVYSDVNAYYALLNGSKVDPAYANSISTGRYTGFSVRCIVRQPQE